MIDYVVDLKAVQILIPLFLSHPALRMGRQSWQLYFPEYNANKCQR